MEGLLKDFDVPAKNPPEEALLRWRKAVSWVVKNRRRRYRFVANLDKRSEAEDKRRKIRVRSLLPSTALHLPDPRRSNFFVAFHLFRALRGEQGRPFLLLQFVFLFSITSNSIA